MGFLVVQGLSSMARACVMAESLDAQLLKTAAIGANILIDVPSAQRLASATMGQVGELLKLLAGQASQRTCVSSTQSVINETLESFAVSNTSHQNDRIRCYVVHEESDDYILVWKPAGVSCFSCSKGKPSELENWVASVALGPGGDASGLAPRACNTLGRGEFGLVILARTQKAFKDATSLIQNGSVKLGYVAVCGGEAKNQTLFDPEGRGPPVDMYVLRIVPSATLGFLSLVSLLPQGYISSSGLRLLLLQSGYPILGNTNLCARNVRARGIMASLIHIAFRDINVVVEPPDRFARMLDSHEKHYLRNLLEYGPASGSKACTTHDKGTARFGDLQLSVPTGVFAPRTGSTYVVKEALHVLEKQIDSRILDVGTGSGCLLLSILHKIPNAIGVGIDLDADAVAAAQANALQLGLGNRTTLRQLRIAELGNLSRECVSAFDVIVANLPYLPEKCDKWLTLARSLHSSPRACHFAGEDGLEAFRELAMVLSKETLLRHGGFIVLETPVIPKRHAESISSIFEGVGFLRVVASESKAKDKVVIMQRPVLL